MSMIGLSKYLLEGGKRLRNSGAEHFPLVSVVTIVLNDAAHLGVTIESVLSQSFGSYEYIVLDGGSSDGSLDVIKKFEERIDYWISEGDRGIYDAMNKAIHLCRGQWVCYLNSGDKFNNEAVLEQVFQDRSAFDHYDFVYGDVVVDFHGFTKLKKAGRLSELWKRMQFSHQSLFTRRSALAERGFNVQQKIAGDFEFIVEAYSKGKHFKHVPVVVSRIEARGISDVKRIEAITARKLVVMKYLPGGYRHLYYSFLLCVEHVKEAAKKALPSSAVRAIQLTKSKL